MAKLRARFRPAARRSVVIGAAAIAAAMIGTAPFAPVAPLSGALSGVLSGPAFAQQPADRSSAEAPKRVVSINLCTDQLAMLLAGPEQLVSVSSLAADPLVSLMAGEARGYALNHAQAEEIFLLKPDLVLAGTYTARSSTEMLRRLGIRVETLPPANSLAEIDDAIIRMGTLLGREAEAAALTRRFAADLAAITPAQKRSGASYDANGYSVGHKTLSGDVMRAAGLDLVPDRLGLHHGGALALEELVLAAPAVIVTGTRYAQPSRAEDILDHPALAGIAAARITIPDRDWICGLPQITRAAAELARLP